MKSMPKKDDAYWMGLALAEAVKARGLTSPNPMVGAVLVKNGKLLAKGYHRRAGLPHAEVEAMRRAKDLRAATLYVTLEPCCHEGKRTPPCAQAILATGIRRIVIGTLDPNPKVSGKGARLLKKAGRQVEAGVLEADCRQINVFYNHWMNTGKPYVLLKAAASLDGRIALKNGRSRWITGEVSRQWVHRLRSEVDAIMVGVGTVIADDPQLTARHPKAKRQPIRIVLDPSLRVPLKAKILNSGPTPCWIVTSPKSLTSRKGRKLLSMGVELIACQRDRTGNFSLKHLLKELGKHSVLSLVVEGGPATWTAFFRQRAAQEFLLFQAPKILGSEAMPLFTELHLQKMPTDTLTPTMVEGLGKDLLSVYRF